MAPVDKTEQRRRGAKNGRPKRTVARPATDLVLTTPPGAARACASGTPPSGFTPVKGVVRALSGRVTEKGSFRTIGAASVTTLTQGNWITEDRCNGTLTQVGRGRASVFDRGLKRTVTVRAGQAYLARARLFAARRQRSH